MKFIQDTPGYNHHTDDAADIYFRNTANQAPTHLHCVGMGYALSSTSAQIFEVELAPFELIGVGQFGVGRPCGWDTATKWTGDSHKYGIYKHGRKLLILESHGGGEQGYYDNSSHAIELFDQLCSSLPSERIWDLCYQIATTENRAYLKGRQEVMTLFLQGRLRHRKRNHRVHVEILPTPANTANMEISYR